MQSGFSREASRVKQALRLVRLFSLHARFFGAKAPQNDAFLRKASRCEGGDALATAGKAAAQRFTERLKAVP